MREPYKPRIDSASIESATYFSKEHASSILERAKKIQEDVGREERLAKQNCVICFTGGKVGGAMCTTSLCGICSKEMHFSSTCTDKLCLGCARDNLLCRHCGGDIDMKKRRNKRPFQLKCEAGSEVAS